MVKDNPITAGQAGTKQDILDTFRRYFFAYIAGRELTRMEVGVRNFGSWV